MTTTNEEVTRRGVTDPEDFPALPDSLKRFPAVVEDAPPIAHYIVDAAVDDDARLPARVQGESEVGQFHHGETASLRQGEPETGSPTDPGPAESRGLVSLSESPALVPILSLVDQAVADAHQVIDLLDGLNQRAIEAGQIVAKAIATYRADTQALKRFVAVLVKANVLTARDGELLERSAKLTKLAKIGRYADVLKRPAISDRVRGFSSLYQALVLLENLPGNETEQTEKLVEILEKGAAHGILSREYLSEQTRQIRQGRKDSEKPKHNSSTVPFNKIDANYDLVLLTPTADDLSRVAGTFHDENNISICGRSYQRCSDNAIIVVVAPVHAIPTVKLWLLEGFAEPRFFLIERSSLPEITNARVIVVAIRGKDSNPQTNGIVLDGEIDLRGLVEQIAPEAKTRLQVFADDEHPGWQVLIGDANWRMDW
jgi:hypothetical protein